MILNRKPYWFCCVVSLLRLNTYYQPGRICLPCAGQARVSRAFIRPPYLSSYHGIEVPIPEGMKMQIPRFAHLK